MLVLSLLAAQPMAAAPAAEEGGRGWFETLEAWWGQLLDRLSPGGERERPAAVWRGSGGDGGPEIDPLGVSAPAEGDGAGDDGPSIDPAGVTSPENGAGDGDAGPSIDPLG